jgi:hypothetical protein
MAPASSAPRSRSPMSPVEAGPSRSSAEYSTGEQVGKRGFPHGSPYYGNRTATPACAALRRRDLGRPQTRFGLPRGSIPPSPGRLCCGLCSVRSTCRLRATLPGVRRPSDRSGSPREATSEGPTRAARLISRQCRSGPRVLCPRVCHQQSARENGEANKQISFSWYYNWKFFADS